MPRPRRPARPRGLPALASAPGRVFLGRSAGAAPPMNEITQTIPRPNNLDAFWMPYTDNRTFKGTPRLLARAEGMSYFTPEGREILDGTAGLWCCNAGHGRREI